MFFNNFVNLCNKSGISPSAAAENMGFKRSVVTRWSQGTQPRQATLQKIADYFGVSVEALTNENKPATPEGSELDSKLIELLTELRPDEIPLLVAYAQGIIAARKK